MRGQRVEVEGKENVGEKGARGRRIKIVKGKKGRQY